MVAAPGPSLTPEVAERCRGAPAIAVQDAWRLMPWAEILYGCDAQWWDHYKGCPGFTGEKWSTHEAGPNEKRATADKYGLQLVRGAATDGFSTDPSVVHYGGGNSGFQAVNLELLLGAATIVLVGFDMQGSHFFGEHPPPLRNGDPRRFVRYFDSAACSLPAGVRILNATPGSALKCFPMVALEDALG